MRKTYLKRSKTLIETNDSRALSFVSDIIKRETGSEIKDFVML